MMLLHYKLPLIAEDYKRTVPDKLQLDGVVLPPAYKTRWTYSRTSRTNS